MRRQRDRCCRCSAISSWRYGSRRRRPTCAHSITFRRHRMKHASSKRSLLERVAARWRSVKSLNELIFTNPLLWTHGHMDIACFAQRDCDHTRVMVSLALIASAHSCFPSMPSFCLAQKPVPSADGQIVYRKLRAAQAQEEEPELRTTTPSAGAAWNMLPTAVDKPTQTQILALAAAGHDGAPTRAAPN